METTSSVMDRHEFFRLVGTSVGAILLTRCSAGCAQSDLNDPTADADQLIDFVLNLEDNENLKVKGGYTVVKNVIVAQTKDGQFLAVSSRCTHQGTQLVYKSVENQFYCPLHLSRFDATGKVLTGPATLPLKQYSVSSIANGTLRVHT